MDLKKLFYNDKAVSPVIGVVLMVAITVILAAAIGSSVFGQGPSESAPQANIEISVHNQTAVKLEHLGGDTIVLNNSAATKIMLANSTGSCTLNGTSCTDKFGVGMTQILVLQNADAGNTPINLIKGELVTIKVVDVKTNQLIADKEMRY